MIEGYSNAAGWQAPSGMDSVVDSRAHHCKVRKDAATSVSVVLEKQQEKMGQPAVRRSEMNPRNVN
jgi:hypothetical protein